MSESNKGKPVEYRIEFYEESTNNDPVYSVVTSSPMFSIAVGDKVEPKAWGEGYFNGVYQVVDVVHLVFDGHTNVHHSLSVVVKPVAR